MYTMLHYITDRLHSILLPFFKIVCNSTVINLELFPGVCHLDGKLPMKHIPSFPTLDTYNHTITHFDLRNVYISDSNSSASVVPASSINAGGILASNSSS